MEAAATNNAVNPEELDNWLESFRQYCEAQNIDISYDNKEFIRLERAYWMGIIAGRGPEAIPPSVQIMLFAARSPLLEHKSPAKKRIRRTKAEMEAERATIAIGEAAQNTPPAA